MYSTIITFKNDIPSDVLLSLREICEKAFDNRAGKAERAESRSNEASNQIVFEGGEACFGCFQLGNISLYKAKGFKDAVAKWEWVDHDDPDESCDILESLSVPIN
ncbi:MAG: hypothetical protein LBD95_06835 [Clostridiales Family XIII bacterium]|nr:hypothetical protein [Clostridiales Family XIII bacterium]